MHVNRRAVLTLPIAVSSVGLLSACTEAAEGEYPSNDITLVVPYDAGGGTDSIARALQPHLQEELGASVVVENRPGGSGAVGMNSVRTAAPDGYTMIMAAASPTIATPLFSDVDYTYEDFSLIGMA